MKIQNKIALTFTALTAGTILILSIFVHIFTSGSIAASFFHRLEVRADIIGHAILEENASRKPIYYDIKKRHLGDLPFEKHRVFLSLDDPSVAEKLSLPSYFFDEMRKGKEARVIRKDTSYIGHTVRSGRRKIYIVASAVDLYGQEEISNLKSALISGFLVALLCTFTLGTIFSEQILRPIRRIIRNVKGINAHNLHQRLVVVDTKDDIADLARTFNDMLDRLEITFEIQNNFVSNASHELRTPLTIISGEAELGMFVPELPDSARQSFQNIYREADRLEHLTSSMLSLAQTGFDGKKEQWDMLRIDELILHVKEAADKIIPDNRIMINFDQLPEDDRKLIVNGNHVLLKAAFTNIVLNSCKYSDNKPVDVLIRADEKHVVVEVTDQGIGIPDREIGQIFVPFFRASNTERYKGYGIGLPLTNNIIRIHQGKLEVQSKVGEGTHVIVELPICYAGL